MKIRYKFLLEAGNIASYLNEDILDFKESFDIDFFSQANESEEINTLVITTLNDNVTRELTYKFTVKENE